MPSYFVSHLYRPLAGLRAGIGAGRPSGGRDGRGASAPPRRTGRGASPVAGMLTSLVGVGAALLIFLLASPPAHSYTVSSDHSIVNVTTFTADGLTPVSASITVTLLTPGQSTVEFLKYAPLSNGALIPGASYAEVGQTWYRTGSDKEAAFAAMRLPTPLGSGAPLDLANPVPLIAADSFHAGEPLFLQVTDSEQNLDHDTRETVVVTLKNEETGVVQVLRLVETGPDTGIFTGFINSADAAGNIGGGTSYSGIFPVSQNNAITARYVNALDMSNTSTARVMVDPLGRVFDSSTGKPLDGATVTLWDVDANDYATVYGDDGASTNVFPAPAAGTKPATVVTGSTPRDSSGRVYAFSPGGFRFPYVKPGRYRLLVTPPSGYKFPSSASDSAIARLTGGPFTVVDGSRGLTFSVNPGPAMRIDLPVDPVFGRLWIQKASTKSQAAIGDAVPFQVTVQNSQTEASLTADSVKVTDVLPQGFRYVKGSTKLNSAAAPDPAISADGRTLTFDIGDLPAKTGVTFSYATMVSAGAALGTATTTATAASGTLSSNTATATVEIRSDFLSTRSIVMGRVYNGSCGEPDGAADQGVPGVRIYLEDGSFVETDKKGMYHFEGVTPTTHVVQLDLDSLPAGYEAAPCEENSRFAGKAYSQFVDLQGGTLWRSDFHLARSRKRAAPGEHDEAEYVRQHAAEIAAADARLAAELAAAGGDVKAGQDEVPEAAPPPGWVNIELKSRVKDDTIEYQVRGWGGHEPLANKRVRITLPHGVAYLAGSSTLDGKGAADPLQEESALIYQLPDSAEEWNKVLALRASAREAGEEGDITTRALLEFDITSSTGLSTPEAENVLKRVGEEETVDMPDIVLHPHFATLSAELSVADRAILDELAARLSVVDIKEVVVSGHTDNVRISPRARRLYPDNNALSLARARSVGEYLMDRLQLPRSTADYSGYGESRPIAPNSSAEGRAMNRRVEILVRVARSLEKSHLEVVKGESGVQKAEIPGVPLPAPKAPEPPPAPRKEAPKDEEDVPGQSIKERPGILSPTDGGTLIHPINGVRVCLDSELAPKLTVDGKEIAAERIGFTLKDPRSGKTIYSYIGVDFGQRGERSATIEGVDPFGVSRFRQTIKVTRSGAVATIRLRSNEGNIADGRTPVRLQLELLDTAGNPIPAAADLEIREGSLKPVKSRDETPESVAGRGDLVHVDLQGNALFQPVSKSGLYKVTLAMNGVKLETETYVKPVMREWILVGLAEGTAGYNAVSGHMESLEGSGVDEKYYDDGRMAFYAKGTVKGEWLLTAAYDSAKSRGATGSGLFQTIDPNTYYTLYGDASQQQYDASSIRKLYLKIEREQFYAMFGDFNTDLTVTELSRYSRRLNGVKTELHGKTLEVNAFGSETGQAYVKDEIEGDGTSGLYHLSRRKIAINSDKVSLQVRDRFRSEVVISTRELTRYTDYSIDYSSGTLLFKEPIYSRDGEFNPIFIVAEYETLDAGTSALTFGGRVGVKLLDQQVRAGVTYLHEGEVSGTGNSLGVDTTIRVGTATTVKLEAARSESNFSQTTNSTGTTSTTGTSGAKGTSGNAFLAEVIQRTARLDSRIYFREMGSGFGLGQQQSSEVGTRKYGLDAGYKLSDALNLNGTANRQYMLSTGVQADRIEGKGNYSFGNYGASLGVRHASDRLSDGSTKESDQLTAGVSLLALDKKLTLKVDRDQSIGANSTADYPTRTTLGADYKLSSQLSLFAQQEFTDGSSNRGNATRAGFKSTPWQGGSLNSSVERKLNENGDRMFALFGLKQSWKLSDHWSVDGGLDRNQTIRSAYRINPNTVSSSGSEDFTAVSLGADYKERSWSWSGRGEYRTSTSEDKWGVLSSILGEPAQGWGWSARLQLFTTEAATQTTVNSDLRLGLVYRPLATRWIILDRMDFLIDRQSGAAGTDSRRIVNNLSANYRPNRKSQVSLQYGAKYVLETYNEARITGYTDLIGLEGRYDLTGKWDVGARASLLHTWGTGQALNSAGVSVGYNIVENAWLSLGYNFTGFSDKDFSSANYTAQGPYIKFRFKFDQNSVNDAVRWLNR